MSAPVNRKIRLFSMVGDHVIMSMICVPIAIAFFPIEMKWGFYCMLVPYLNKDFLQGRSPAKRLLGLQLQDATGAPVHELRAFLRNVTAMLWPIEVLLIAVGSQKRLGDYIAGTQVVASATVTAARSWQQGLASYRITSYTLYTLLATFFYLLLLHVFFSWIGL